MIHAFALGTSEIDDAAAAVQDILSQTATLSLAAHSVGIVVCHHDFVTGGIVDALSDALPFPLLGFTTFYQATSHANGLFELSLTVLTSDDVRFVVDCAYSAERDDNPTQTTTEAYRRAAARCGDAPSLILSFLTADRPITGDAYLRLIDECSGGVPNFGAVSVGDSDDGSDLYVICEKNTFTYGFAMLLCVGDVKSACYVGNYKVEKLVELTTTVTRSEGTLVQALNGHPAVPYLRENGFQIGDDESTLISNVPFLFKMPGDNTLIARTLAGFDIETGALRFLGEVPQDALLRIGTTSFDDIVSVSHAVVSQAVAENPAASAMLMFSCVGRYISLGLAPTSELEHVAGLIPAGIPYLSCYGGGELCPVDTSQGLQNRYHNASFIVCALS